MGKLAGKFPGGYGGAKGASGNMKAGGGHRGRGTMPYQTVTHPTNQKDIIAGTGQRAPMPNGNRGRVLYSSANKRLGRAEGTGAES